MKSRMVWSVRALERVALVVALVGCTGANVGGTSEDEAGVACAPACRPGFVCLRGSCVSACNPPCDPGATCGGDGLCHAASEVDASVDRADPAPSAEGPSRDAARAGSDIAPAAPGTGVCATADVASRSTPWVCQRINTSLSWNTNMCCGSAVVTMAIAAARGVSTISANDQRATIDWMNSNLTRWSANGYNCDPSGTDSDQVVAALRGLGGLASHAIRTTWCELTSRYLDAQHIVIMHGDSQGGNSTRTFVAGASHWLILTRVVRGSGSDGIAYVNDPGRSDAAQGANRAYSESSVRARFESPARGGLAIIVDLAPSCAPDCAGRTCGLDTRCGISCGTCPSGQQCDARGACAAGCSAGVACSNGNPCDRSETSCEPGGARCVRTGSAPRGTPCGAGMICDGAGGCGPATCATGTADCDGAGVNGCETNTLTSVANCGGCGRRCALTNANAACVGGRCVVSSCASGAGDCDAVPENGCEVFLPSDARNCGACGRACASGASCVAGACTPAPECSAGSARSCMTGQAGVCASGQQSCASGRFGTCVPLSSPSVEVCDTSRDEDCDGLTDEGCCTAIAAGPTLVAPSNAQHFTSGRAATFSWRVVSGCEGRPSWLKIRQCVTAGCSDPARDASGTLMLERMVGPGVTSASVTLSYPPGSYRWVVEQGNPRVAPMYYVVSIDP